MCNAGHKSGGGDRGDCRLRARPGHRSPQVCIGAVPCQKPQLHRVAGPECVSRRSDSSERAWAARNVIVSLRPPASICTGRGVIGCRPSRIPCSTTRPTGQRGDRASSHGTTDRDRGMLLAYRQDAAEEERTVPLRGLRDGGDRWWFTTFAGALCYGTFSAAALARPGRDGQAAHPLLRRGPLHRAQHHRRRLSKAGSARLTTARRGDRTTEVSDDLGRLDIGRTGTPHRPFGRCRRADRPTRSGAVGSLRAWRPSGTTGPRWAPWASPPASSASAGSCCWTWCSARPTSA